MISKILFIICITFASALIPGAGQAQDLASARVLAIEGQVEIRRQGSDQARVRNISFKAEDELRAGDTIITGKSGRLVLGLSDGSQAVIAPKTTVVIKDLSASPRALFYVIRGKTRIHIEKLGGQPNPYRVDTPTAVIAVRGTIFDVLVEEEETQVFLHEGEVAVTNPTAPDKAVFLLAGQMTRVPLQRVPNAPTAFKAGRNDAIFQIRLNDGKTRIAVGVSRPDFGRGGSAPNRGAKPDFGRGVPPPNGSKPNTGGVKKP
ncbi:MAG: FecR family protein [Blastocatellia bacterium]